MSEKLDEILMESTGILLAVDELRKQIPKFDNIKNEIQSQKEDIHNEINNFIKQEHNDREKIKQYINKNTEKINELLTQVEEKLEETIKIHESIKNINDEIKKKTKDSSNKNTEDINSVIDLVADYAAPHSIAYLFNKYKNTKTPVIVRKIESTPDRQSMWSDNMCFYVKDIKNDKAIGDYYVDGVITNREYPPNVTKPLYALYSNRDEIEKIVASKS